MWVSIRGYIVLWEIFYCKKVLFQQQNCFRISRFGALFFDDDHVNFIKAISGFCIIVISYG